MAPSTLRRASCRRTETSPIDGAGRKVIKRSRSIRPVNAGFIRWIATPLFKTSPHRYTCVGQPVVRTIAEVGIG